MKTTKYELRTPSRDAMIYITPQVQRTVSEAGVRDGLATIYVPHTTAGVTINENADPAVRQDMAAVLDRLVPWSDGYAHDEGNSAAHVKASLMGFTAARSTIGCELLMPASMPPAWFVGLVKPKVGVSRNAGS